MDGCATVLVVDDNERNVRLLRDRLIAEGHRVIEAGDGEAALRKARDEGPDLVLLDILMPGMDGYQVLERLKADEGLRHVPVIVISAVDQTDSIVKCLALGAEDYLCKPFNGPILKARIGACLEKKSWHDREESYRSRIEESNAELERRVSERTAELRDALREVEQLKNRLEAENTYLRQEIDLAHDFTRIVCGSGAFGKVLEMVERVAGTDATVLILGETGTGKELVARAVHGAGMRKDRPLVKVNCAALPAALIESELFGHEKGAFTGAAARRIGRFELADGGTIFLDEIADLPLELQSKLLRVLQEGEIERLGSAATIRVNARVIAATNRDLAETVAKGAFREDLCYRLNVFLIRCPPLRERKEDIPLLVGHFVAEHGAKIGRRVESVPDRILQELATYDWPGNVRELENVVERALIMNRGKQLELGDWLPKATIRTGVAPFPTMEEKERGYIVEVLELTGWKIRGTGGAAELLDVKPTTLEARMQRLGIKRREGSQWEKTRPS